MPTPPEIIACPHCGGTIEAGDGGIGAELVCPLCGQPFLHHRHFSHYTIERKIGAGGMATVHLARDDADGRAVAVKVLNRRFSADERFLQMFSNEARITAALVHPNVVQVYETGASEGQSFLAMEYLAGGSLDDRMAAGRWLTEAEALAVAEAVVPALQLAASRGLIHRDIKPGNLLFTAEGGTKLVDFGLCLAIVAQQPATTEVWGTPAYLPPERLQREPEDFRSDMYSLGATLFHALAGRPIYLEKDPLQIVAAHRTEKPTALREAMPQASPELAALIDRATAWRPEDRFDSYEAMLEEIGRVKRIGEARPKPQPGRAAQLGEPWPLWKLALAFLLFAGLSAALMLAFFWKAVFPPGQ